MSETEGEEEGGPGPAGREIWIEKYRPQSLAEVVGHEDIVDRLESYIERDDLPNLLFAGPAGTGKCLTGDTPVLTNEGVRRIDSVVGDVDGFDAPDEGLEVLTFDESGDFQYVEPSHVYGKRAENLVTVETRDGGETTVTPEHQFLVVDEDGLGWRPAEELRAGDRVVRPLQTPVEEDPTLDWIDSMNGRRTFVTVSESFARSHEIPPEENQVGSKRAVLRGVRNGRSDTEIAETVDVTQKTVAEYRRKLDSDPDDVVRTCSLSYLRSIDVDREDARAAVERIQYVNEYDGRSAPIDPPWRLDPDLARFVALAVSEARIDGGRIKFYNTDPHLLDEFERIARETFDADPVRGRQHDVPYVRVGSRTLTHYLESCFDVFDSVSNGSGIGSAILSGSEETRAAFLRAMFDAEGHVSEKGIVELTQKNERTITLLSYLLATFGIPSRRDTDWKAATNGSGTEREYHTLYVSGARNLSKFEDAIGFSAEEKARRLAEHAAKSNNPNQDTIPVQSAVDDLCDALNLSKTKHTTETLNPDTPGRESYLEDVEQVLGAATERLAAANDVEEEVGDLRDEIDAVTRIPAAWVQEREKLEAIEARKRVERTVGPRSDYLLEYADGRRTPRARRAERILETIDSVEERPDVTAIQTRLADAIETTGIEYAEIAEGTHLRGTDVANLLENEDHDLGSLPRFGTVADRVVELAEEMRSVETVEKIRSLRRLLVGNLYFDEVTAVTENEDEGRVYDLTVPGTRNYVAGNVPTVMHNTTSAVAIAREIYSDDWREQFLELNASDDRGIDVVRGRIKEFARSAMNTQYDYRIIFLDEADSLTDEAQAALRRTMEQFSDNTRFVLSCNYSSQIIDPIQSRCAMFRFSAVRDEAVGEYVRTIAAEEDIKLTDDAVDALVYVADGDMRKAINALQAAAVTGEEVDEEGVYAITSTARPEEVEAMVSEAIGGDFTAARATLDQLLTDRGIAGGDVVDQIHRSVWEFDLQERQAVRVLERLGEADYRIAEGANERVQLEALLAALARRTE